MTHPGLLLVGFISALAMAGVGVAAEPFRTTAVVKVRAHHSHGRSTSGSAVLLDSERLVTNCHVIASARELEILQGASVVPAVVVARDRERDVCLLRAPGVSGEPASVSRHAAVGQSVYAAGFFRYERFAVTSGRILALHDHDSAQVLQVSTHFDRGASGGGLFDEQGHLIGILTFRARAAGAYYFAVPAQWIDDVQQAGATKRTDEAPAFWQQPPDRQPFFLRAISLELDQNWDALALLGKDWTRKNPSEPRAWMVLETALRHLQRGGTGQAHHGIPDAALVK